MGNNELVAEYISMMQIHIGHLIGKKVSVHFTVGEWKDIDINHTIKLICDALHVPLDEVLSTKYSTREITEARHICWLIIRDTCRLSLKGIAKYFGGKDHTTIMNGIRKIRGYLECGDEVVQLKYNKAINVIKEATR